MLHVVHAAVLLFAASLAACGSGSRSDEEVHPLDAAYCRGLGQVYVEANPTSGPAHCGAPPSERTCRIRGQSFDPATQACAAPTDAAFNYLFLSGPMPMRERLNDPEGVFCLQGPGLAALDAPRRAELAAWIVEAATAWLAPLREIARKPLATTFRVGSEPADCASPWARFELTEDLGALCSVTRACAFPATAKIVLAPGQPDNYGPFVILHEMGHLLGLADLYPDVGRAVPVEPETRGCMRNFAASVMCQRTLGALEPADPFFVRRSYCAYSDDVGCPVPDARTGYFGDTQLACSIDGVAVESTYDYDRALKAEPAYTGVWDPVADTLTVDGVIRDRAAGSCAHVSENARRLIAASGSPD